MAGCGWVGEVTYNHGRIQIGFVWEQYLLCYFLDKVDLMGRMHGRWEG